MKKSIALLLALILGIALFAGCAGKTDDNGSISDTPDTTQNDNTTPDTTDSGNGEGSAATGMNKGDTGEGPAALDTSFAAFTIPEGMQYKINNITTAENPASEIEIKIGLNDTSTGYLLISPTRMVKSLDDAVNECERMKSYNGKRVKEDRGEVTYGGMKYKVLAMSEEKYTMVYYVAYYLDTVTGTDMYVEIEVSEKSPFSTLSADDPLLIAMIGSITYKNK